MNDDNTCFSGEAMNTLKGAKLKKTLEYDQYKVPHQPTAEMPSHFAGLSGVDMSKVYVNLVVVAQCIQEVWQFVK